MVNLFWFRRDLRSDDNHGLFEALKSDNPTLPIFIFDRSILDLLKNKKDARVEFIFDQVMDLKKQFEKHKSSLRIEIGKPIEVFKKLSKEFEIKSVYCNEDYEPYARERDQKVKEYLESQKIDFLTFKDQVIHDYKDVLKDSGDPYSVYTPYAKKWRKVLKPIPHFASEKNLKNGFQIKPQKSISLKDIGFESTEQKIPKPQLNPEFLKKYGELRNFMGQSSTTHVDVHLRFGTLSIRKLAQLAQKTSPVYLGELIWREFFMAVLYYFPHTVDKAFKPKYDKIKFRNDKKEFKAWCEGKTGYDIVDAAMTEINQTGFMHNRARLIVSSFLCKHLLIDWRWGERYFAEKLHDFEQSSNVGNWQWAAGCGCDAAPYFRIFNPMEQAKKFDADKNYRNKWLKGDQPSPIVNHQEARERCLETYRKALKS